MRKLAAPWLVLLVFVPVVAAGFDSSPFRFEAPVLEPGKDALSGFVRVPVPSRVLAEARFDLHDLRLVDDHGTEVSYVVRKADRRGLEQSVPARLLNRGMDPAGRFQQFVCDLGPGARVSNQLRIVTPDRNFVRRVDVAGSTDGNNWIELRRGVYVFDLHEAHPLQNFRLSYPDSSYRYLQVLVWLDGNPPITVSGVEVVNEIQSRIPPETLKGTIIDRRDDPQRKVTDLMVDVGYPNQHLEECLLDLKQENFQRIVTVWYQDSRGVWVEAGREVIYRLKFGSIVEERVTVALTDLNDRLVRVRVSNEDSPPLDVNAVSFRRMAHFVVFTPVPRRSYRLFFGDQQAGPRFYDVDEIASRVDLSRMPVWTLGEIAANPGYVAKVEEKPWTERHPGILWPIVGVGVVLLVALILRTLREVKG